jgi:PPM family protein phosphatase
VDLYQAQAQSELRYGVVSKQGGRPYNEDYCTVHDYTLRRNPKYLCFMAMADGMGGHQAGDIASSVAVQMLEKYTSLSGFSSNQEFEEKAERVLWNAFSAANSHIHDLGKANPDHEGMGTTLTCALIDFDYAYIGHVGDTRAYTVSSAGITQITADHSVVGQMVTEGIITEQEARTHVKRNILTRAVGPELNVEIDLLRLPVQTGDIMFMCSDGLYATVTDGEIYQVLGTEMNLRAACTRLVDLAISRGSDDNVSAIAWKMPPQEVLSAGATGRRFKRKKASASSGALPVWAVVLVALAVLLIGFGIGWGIGALFFSNKTPTKTAGVTSTSSGTSDSSASQGSSSTKHSGPADSTGYSKGASLVVTDGPCNLRASPGTTGQIVAQLQNGCPVKTLAEIPVYDSNSKQWYQVEVTDTPAKGKKGYVYYQYIKLP